MQHITTKIFFNGYNNFKCCIYLILRYLNVTDLWDKVALEHRLSLGSSNCNMRLQPEIVTEYQLAITNAIFLLIDRVKQIGCILSKKNREHLEFLHVQQRDLKAVLLIRTMPCAALKFVSYPTPMRKDIPQRISTSIAITVSWWTQGFKQPSSKIS